MKVILFQEARPTIWLNLCDMRLCYNWACLKLGKQKRWKGLAMDYRWILRKISGKTRQKRLEVWSSYLFTEGCESCSSQCIPWPLILCYFKKKRRRRSSFWSIKFEETMTDKVKQLPNCRTFQIFNEPLWFVTLQERMQLFQINLTTEHLNILTLFLFFLVEKISRD